ncbi:hypothetical protein GCM10007047_01120 [Cerasicoccus arenae]|uniref:Uncharacterized protein n=1 Tax=Cerasicoccus arenae TaxID=424488 RepID=A0A8J3DCQ9_9BACT|nr:hypothetical protein GCM10007047_01120 [Cerasicoccus arenae]
MQVRFGLGQAANEFAQFGIGRSRHVGDLIKDTREKVNAVGGKIQAVKRPMKEK